MIVNLIAYSAIWFVLFFLLKLLPSKYLVSANQRNNAVVVIHALFCSVFTLVYFTLFQPMTDYVSPQNWATTQFLTIAGAFYIFAIVIMFFLERKVDWFTVFHHVVLAAFITYFLYNVELPAYYTIIAFFILPAIFYNSFLVYKESEGYDKEFSKQLFKWNAVSWLLIRILLYAAFILYALYCEWLEVNPKTLPYRYVLFTVLITFCFFSSYYYVFIRKKVKIMNNE